MAETNDNLKNEESAEESVHLGIPDKRGKKTSPWAWVPSLYFAESIPYVIVQILSIIMFKKMGVSNKDIVLYTSLLYLPWTIKPLWSPLVDIIKTKRWWVYLMQAILAASMFGIAFGIQLPNFFIVSMFFLWIMAFSSATHDIAADGFYMLGLSKHQQAWYVGIRSTFYRIGIIVGQGFLVIIAGFIESHSGLTPLPVNVQTNPDLKEKTSIIKMIDPAEDETSAVNSKSDLDKLVYYSEKIKSASDLNEAAGISQRAKTVVNTVKKDTPDEATKAEDILKTITTSYNDTLSSAILSMIAEKQNEITPLDGEIRLIASTENLEIPTGTITTTESDLNIALVKKWNELQGQKEVVLSKDKPKESKGEKKGESGWQTNVVKPLEKFLRDNFGQQKVKLDQAGNIGFIYFHLSKAPEKGKDIVVNFGMKSGDKTIVLKEGVRFVFNESNWNKPVVSAIQIDHKLKEKNETLFRADAGNIPLSWMSTFIFLAACFILFAAYHYFILPKPHSDTSKFEDAKITGVPFKVSDLVKEFIDTFVTFFQKKGIVWMILYLLLYRFAESQLTGLNTPFYLDSRENGGLALTTENVGFIYGTVGVVFLVIGGLLGGFVAARDGLKKWIFPMALAINIPDAVYVIMAYTKPESIAWITSLVAFETFGYGFGFAAYMLYMIFVAEGKHKTAHFALATGLMALGMMIPRMPCGWLQEIIGYKHFFVWVMIATIPSFIVTLIIPLDPEFGKKKSSEKK